MPDPAHPTPRWIRWPDGDRSRFAHGADYNPEQWPREVWAEDMRLMQEAGVNIVSLGIFSWSLLEPRDGVYDFSFLDEAMDLLHAHRIAVDLATATASTPPWLAHAHPDMELVDADGRRHGFGGRQSWCPSSPVYRERSTRLVRALAEHVRDHPALALWHVSNELGCHNARCYCPTSAEAFRRWLAERYGTVDALNAAWTTAFWSQRYGSFAEIEPPRRAAAQVNPTQQLDFARFSDHELLAQYRAEAAILAEVTPDVPRTTNFMVTSRTRDMDYLSWGPEMDLVSTDHYLRHDARDTALELAFSADWTRGCASGRPWLLMEQSTSAVNWGPVNTAKEPGELWRNSLAQVARGADGICYFQWRASAGGGEKFHSAIVPHAGPDTRIFAEVCEQGRALPRLAEVLGTTVSADVALLVDYEAWWASELDSHPRQDFRYADGALAWYEPLYRAGVGVDVIGPGTPLDGYRVLVIPHLYLVSDATAEAVSAFAQDGGTVLVTWFSGIADPDDRVRLGGYPGAFRDLLGIRSDEFRPLPAGTSVPLSDGSHGTYWSEDVRAEGAETVLSYTDGALADQPAVTRHTVGAGSAWYVSTGLDRDARRSLLDRLLAEAKVTPPADATGPVEQTERVAPDGTRYLFCINHSDAPVRVAAGGTDLLTGREHPASVTLAAGASVVLRRPA